MSPPHLPPHPKQTNWPSRLPYRRWAMIRLANTVPGFMTPGHGNYTDYTITLHEHTTTFIHCQKELCRWAPRILALTTFAQYTVGVKITLFPILIRLIGVQHQCADALHASGLPRWKQCRTLAKRLYLQLGWRRVRQQNQEATGREEATIKTATATLPSTSISSHISTLPNNVMFFLNLLRNKLVRKTNQMAPL